MAHPKGVLIERLQKEGRQPRFDTRASGPDHEPMFEAEVHVDDEVIGRGRGSNKRTAERRAAEEALVFLDEAERGTSAEAADEVAGATSADADEVGEDLPFEGPWPVFESVLATSLQIAHARVEPNRSGAAARSEIEAFALELYKNVLQDLGDVVELDD